MIPVKRVQQHHQPGQNNRNRDHSKHYHLDVRHDGQGNGHRCLRYASPQPLGYKPTYYDGQNHAEYPENANATLTNWQFSNQRGNQPHQF